MFGGIFFLFSCFKQLFFTKKEINILQFPGRCFDISWYASFLIIFKLFIVDCVKHYRPGCQYLLASVLCGLKRHRASQTPVKMGNEMSDQKKAKGKPKQEAPRNVPDGEAISSKKEDQTGSERCLYLL